MIWYILIALFTGLILWILLVPVIIKLDTSRNLYRFMLPGIVSASVVPTADFFLIRCWVLFIPFTIDPLRMKGRSKTKQEKVKKKKKRKRPSGRKLMKKFRNVTRAIRLRRLELDIDTDDFLLNAWLVPAFAAVNSYRNIQMQVNFEGNLFLHLDVRTRIAAMLWQMMPWRLK
jgi:hypothetical protein